MPGLKRIFYLLHEDAWIVIHIFLCYYWKTEHPIVFLLLCNRRDLFFIRVSKLLDRSSPKSMWFLWNIFSKGTHMLQCLCGKSLKKNKNPSGKSHCVFFPSMLCADLQSNLCSKSVNAGKLRITWALVVRPITHITAEGFNIQLFSTKSHRYVALRQSYSGRVRETHLLGSFQGCCSILLSPASLKVMLLSGFRVQHSFLRDYVQCKDLMSFVSFC